MPLPIIAALGLGAAAKYLLVGAGAVTAGAVTVAIATSSSENDEDLEEIQRLARQRARKKAKQAKKAALLRAEQAKCRRAKEDLDRRIQNFVNFTRGNRIKGCCNGLTTQTETKKPITLKRQLSRLTQNSIEALEVEPNVSGMTYEEARIRRDEQEFLCRQLHYMQDLVISETMSAGESRLASTKTAKKAKADTRRLVNTHSSKKKAKQVSPPVTTPGQKARQEKVKGTQ